MQPLRAQLRPPDWSRGEAGFSSDHKGPIRQQGRASPRALSAVCVQVESGVLALGGGELEKLLTISPKPSCASASFGGLAANT